MNRPDGYYGDVAASYQGSREVKPKWKAEQAAVEAFLTEGPVLDVPFGTGRFVPLYRSKGLDYTGIEISQDMLAQARARYGEINASIGSAFDLRFGRGEFGTAVCVRFLEWLPIETGKTVLDRLREVAGTLIVTITHGAEGKPEAYTHDYGKFLGIIDGLMIEARRITASVRGMTSEIFKLRPAQWGDVVEQFTADYPETAEFHIQRLADKFAGFVGLPPTPVRKDSVNVRMEYWSGARIGCAARALAGHRFLTGDPPRVKDRPATAVVRYGCDLIIDGRKRANQWMREPGPHPVLVVRPNG